MNTIQQQAYQDRQRRYAAEIEPRRRASMRELEELFDRRNDGVAPMRRFREKLRCHVAIYGDGKAGTSECRIFSELLQDERRLQRALGSHRVNRDQWLLARKIEPILVAQLGVSDAELAERLGTGVTELRRVLWAMYGQRRLDRCWSYNVLPSRGRRAEARSMTAISELLAAMPDPAAVDEHWRRICREMVKSTAAAQYERGLLNGYLLAIADFKAFQHGAVRDAQLERRRWHLCCRRCRLTSHRDSCRDCEDRARETYGDPRPGDYPGRGLSAA